MNLQKNDIKRYILRRYSIDELESIFNQKLNNQSRNFKHHADMSSNKFVNIVVNSITDAILEQLTDGWVEDSPISEEVLYEFIQEIFGETIIRKYDELRSMNLQENIRRIKEMMNLNEKLEDIQGTPLYHKTSTNRGLDIINSDSLRGVLPSGDYLGLDTRLANTKTQTAISFTRDKNWQPNNTIGIGLDSSLEDTGITFVVDKDKLKTKYKVEPFNYHGIDSDSEYKEKFNELEERVMTNEIYPLHKYVIDIIYTGDNPEVQQIIDNYLNR